MKGLNFLSDIDVGKYWRVLIFSDRNELLVESMLYWSNWCWSNQRRTCLNWSGDQNETRMLSMHVYTDYNPYRTLSIKRWNVLAAFIKPNEFIQEFIKPKECYHCRFRAVVGCYEVLIICAGVVHFQGYVCPAVLMNSHKYEGLDIGLEWYFVYSEVVDVPFLD